MILNFEKIILLLKIEQLFLSIEKFFPFNLLITFGNSLNS